MISTPCIKICVLDLQGQTCIGCRRTAVQIQDWPFLSEQERKTIINDLPIKTSFESTDSF